MRECRFFPWCSYIEDHGCTDDWCEHYQPMPDVDALLKLADEIDQTLTRPISQRIRESLGVES